MRTFLMMISFMLTIPMPKPINVPIDIGSAYRIFDVWQNRIKEIFFLDIFSLIEKNRMPVTEINIRRSDGFKQLGMYVAADTATNLEPEVLTIMKMDAHKNKIPPPSNTGQLKVTYISPVIQAIKSTSLDEAMRILDFSGSVDGVSPGTSRKNIDYNALLAKVLDKTNNTDIALPPEMRAIIEQQEQLEQEVRAKEALIKAGRESDQRIMGLENARPRQDQAAETPRPASGP